MKEFCYAVDYGPKRGRSGRVDYEAESGVRTSAKFGVSSMTANGR